MVSVRCRAVYRHLLDCVLTTNAESAVRTLVPIPSSLGTTPIPSERTEALLTPSFITTEESRLGGDGSDVVAVRKVLSPLASPTLPLADVLPRPRKLRISSTD
jgi:hypothetical protein